MGQAMCSLPTTLHSSQGNKTKQVTKKSDTGVQITVFIGTILLAWLEGLSQHPTHRKAAQDVDL